jgi:hypothetical protein
MTDKIILVKGDKEIKINDRYDSLEVMVSHGWSVKGGKPVETETETEAEAEAPASKSAVITDEPEAPAKSKRRARRRAV